ncbi:MAG: hypothetical protein DI539_21710, partial [Flavobacterium psychrophilum]
NSIQEIVKYLKQKGERMSPLYESDVDSIEKECNVKLPGAYKEFLLYMGRGAGRYMIGSDVFYDKMLHLQFWAEELAKENNLQPLPPGSFTFWMHQGYRAAYFMTGDGEDPAVYFYSEEKGIDGFKIITNSLTDFFLYQLKVSFCEDEFDLPNIR